MLFLEKSERRKNMSANQVYLLQAVLFFLQFINAGIGTVTHSALITLFVSGFVGAFQLYVNKIGVEIQPPNKPRL
jgi:hypothetical protein